HGEVDQRIVIGLAPAEALGVLVADRLTAFFDAKLDDVANVVAVVETQRARLGEGRGDEAKKQNCGECARCKSHRLGNIGAFRRATRGIWHPLPRPLSQRERGESLTSRL